MYLASNLSAVFAENALLQTESLLQTQEVTLATGLADPSPEDNPADQVMATLMQGELGVLTQNSQNIAEGINFLQTAAGAQQQAMGLLQQLDSLAIQASNSGLTPQDLAPIDQQAQQILSMLNTLNQTFLGLTSVTLDTPEQASRSLAAIRQAMTQLSTWQAIVGSQLDALYVQARNVATQHTQLETSQATLHDANIPGVISAFARQQILLHTGLQSLMTARQQPQRWYAVLQRVQHGSS